MKPNKSAYMSNNKGLSLLEIMITISILSLIILIGTDFIIGGLKSSSFMSQQEEAVMIARKSSEAIAKQLREIRGSENGGYPIASAGSQDLTVFGDDNGDGRTDKIRYHLSGSTLLKEVTQPGASNSYDGSPVSTEAASYVNNQAEAIFTYYDENKSVTAEINRIRLIRINLKINVNPSIAPQDIYVENDIQLRNLKDNL
jgi:prepilin-type N-terminal cleavage/methylation domain-containing protein